MTGNGKAAFKVWLQKAEGYQFVRLITRKDRLSVKC